MPTISQRDQAHIWHPFTQMKDAPAPLAIARGEREFLFDEDGNQHIDGISSWWVNIHGHSHPYIAQEVSKQLNTLEHVIFAGFTHEPAVELSEKLIQVLPKNQNRVFFSDNGSTSVEVGLKMAFQYWYNEEKPKTKVVAFNAAYHGDTLGAMSVGGPSAFNAPFGPFLFDVEHIDVPTPGNESKTIAQLQHIIEQGDVAAFIFEPLMMGAGGMLIYTPEILEELILMCKRHGVLTIADEVLTGFGRTGRYFASDYLATHPDIICMSKGITGGTMALGVTSCTEDIYRAFLSTDKKKTFFHGHSFTANPVACRCAIASMFLLSQDECWDNIKRIEKLQYAFSRRLSQFERATNIRHLGTMVAFDLASDDDTSYFNEKRDAIYQHFLERKIILRPLGNTIYILPPYCTSDESLAHIYMSIEALLTASS